MVDHEFLTTDNRFSSQGSLAIHHPSSDSPAYVKLKDTTTSQSRAKIQVLSPTHCVQSCHGALPQSPTSTTY